MGSCYSTDKLPPAQARSLQAYQNNRPLDQRFPAVKGNQTPTAIRTNQHRNRLSLRGKELHPHPRPISSTKRHLASPDITKATNTGAKKALSTYSELPLISLSQSQATSEPEEYDNSSVNISECFQPINGNLKSRDR